MRFVRTLPKGIYQNNFSLPEIGLADPQGVVDNAIASTRIQSVGRTLSRPETPFLSILPEELDRARERFHEIAGHHSDRIPIHYVGEVIREMGIFIDNEDVEELQRQLGEKESQGLSFADITEIASFIQAEITSRAHL